MFEGLGPWGGVTCRDTDGDGRSSPEWLGSLEAARPTFGARSIGARVEEGMEGKWHGDENEGKAGSDVLLIGDGGVFARADVGDVAANSGRGTHA